MKYDTESEPTLEGQSVSKSPNVDPSELPDDGGVQAVVVSTPASIGLALLATALLLLVVAL